MFGWSGYETKVVGISCFNFFFKLISHNFYSALRLKLLLKSFCVILALYIYLLNDSCLIFKTYKLFFSLSPMKSVKFHNIYTFIL